MKFRRNSNRTTVFLFLFILLAIGIGYAYLTSNLSITGATSVTANTWDIHFANLQVSTGSVDATTPAAIDTNDNTLINYSVSLNRPGDFYEFTVDMVNAGTLPCKLTLVELNGITSAVEDVIDYSVVYTNNNIPVAVSDVLNASSSKNIKVRVYYKKDIDNNDLLTSNVNLTLTFGINFNQSDKDEVTIDTIIQQLKTENSSCFTKYEGQVTDQVGQTVSASNVYFNKCADKRNIVFNNMCWQMIRTTETSGIKMIYNGDVVDGKCESSRGDHKGIVGANGSSQTVNAEYLYGDSFTYDTTSNIFTLTDTTTTTWSDSTYEDLIGKFTCKSSSDTCTTIYQINGYSSNTKAYLSSYTIGDTNYAEVGKSPFNANNDSPAMVGYMFNKVYKKVYGAPTSGSLIGNDVSYSNGTYTLLPADGETVLGTTLDNTHHYTCNNTSGSCNKVRYYFRNYNYIELDGEANIEEAVNNMLYDDNVNRYNSSTKGIIDTWYKQNMLSITNKLEDTVYCNARNMINQNTNGWNKNGSLSSTLKFKNFDTTTALSCLNTTDQFAVSNNKAKLTYPVSLATGKEMEIIENETLLITGSYYYLLSPIDFSDVSTVDYITGDTEIIMDFYSDISLGIRPVISIVSSAEISLGSGSEIDPWVIE